MVRNWQLSSLEVGEDNSKFELKNQEKFKAINMVNHKLFYGFLEVSPDLPSVVD